MQENLIQFYIWMQIADDAEPQPYSLFIEKTPSVTNEK